MRKALSRICLHLTACHSPSRVVTGALRSKTVSPLQTVPKPASLFLLFQPLSFQAREASALPPHSQVQSFWCRWTLSLSCFLWQALCQGQRAQARHRPASQFPQQGLGRGLGRPAGRPLGPRCSQSGPSLLLLATGCNQYFPPRDPHCCVDPVSSGLVVLGAP